MQQLENADGAPPAEEGAAVSRERNLDQTCQLICPKTKAARGQSPHIMDDLDRAAAIHRRIDAWRADLEQRFAKAQMLVACGAPDPNFDALGDELQTFRHCIEVLAWGRI